MGPLDLNSIINANIQNLLCSHLPSHHSHNAIWLSHSPSQPTSGAKNWVGNSRAKNLKQFFPFLNYRQNNQNWLFVDTNLSTKYADLYSASSQSTSNALRLPISRRWSPLANPTARHSANTARPRIRVGVSCDMPVYSHVYSKYNMLISLIPNPSLTVSSYIRTSLYKTFFLSGN